MRVSNIVARLPKLLKAPDSHLGITTEGSASKYPLKRALRVDLVRQLACEGLDAMADCSGSWGV
jgi:hypothetical protein